MSVFRQQFASVLLAAGAVSLLPGCVDGPGVGPYVDPYPAVWKDPPACGASQKDVASLIPAATQPGYDDKLAVKASRFDRQFHVFNGYLTGGNADVTIATNPEARQAIEHFVKDTDSWDFFATTGKRVPDVITRWAKVSGAYAGPGIAADSYWYGTLRDQGADCEQVERARAFVLQDLDVLHTATAITGVRGVISRGYARGDLPGDSAAKTTPLFDGQGNPLPAKKNNGSWRKDNSGDYPGYVWEDSCSRDYLIGWMVGFAGIWEVIADDPTFPKPLKDRLQQDATDIALSLMQVGDKGYDLEIHDADGRVTYHGRINEAALERAYFAGLKNGMYALMALGIVSSLAYVSRDPRVVTYLRDELIGKRHLDQISLDSMILDAGLKSNFSGYNMAFEGAWLSYRYLPWEKPRSVIQKVIARELYARPGASRQPIEQKQTFYDFVYAISQAQGTAFSPVRSASLDQEAIDRGLETLGEFWEPPYFAEGRTNCDEQEIASGQCVGIDGTPIHVLGNVGRSGDLVAEKPLPMRIRPASNYYWRSNPYIVNGGDNGTALLPANDFRLCYWLARWQRKVDR